MEQKSNGVSAGRGVPSHRREYPSLEILAWTVDILGFQMGVIVVETFFE